MQKRRIVPALLLALWLLPFSERAATTHAAANLFPTSEVETITIAADGHAHVHDDIRITRTTPSEYLSNYSSSYPSASLTNLTASASGQTLAVTKQPGNDNSTEINVSFGGSPFWEPTVFTFTFDFDVSNVATQDGRIWSVNVPGLQKNYDGDYQLRLVAPASFGPLFYLNAPADQTAPATGGATYVFGKARLLGQDVLAEFGTDQVYKLTFDYDLANQNAVPLAYDVTLPTDLDTQQTVIESISPAPDDVIVDGDGNHLAVFTVPASSHLPVHIVTDVRVWPKTYTVNENAPISAIPASLQTVYTAGQPYWQVNNPLIVQNAQKLDSGHTTVVARARAVYQFTASQVKYSSERARIILSSFTSKDLRKGAVKALQSQSGVCMEYADLFVTLTRASGIPARWRAGLAYQSKDDRNKPALQLGHAWADFYAPGQGWVPVDPTWGSAGDYFARADVNHITLSILGHTSTTPLYVTYQGVNIDLPKTATLTPLSQEVTGKPILAARITSPSTRLPWQNSTVQVSVTNDGSTTAENVVATVKSPLVSGSSTQYTLGSLPPYAHRVYSVPLTHGSVLPNTATVTVSVTGDDGQNHPVSAKASGTVSLGVAVGHLSRTELMQLAGVAGLALLALLWLLAVLRRLMRRG